MWLPSLALLLFADAAASDVEAALRKFAEVYGLVESQAADPVDANGTIYEGALPSMMRGLDPHSAFLSPDQMEQLRQMERSTSKGFGTVVSVLPGRVIILQVVQNAPSARAGLAPGDEIVGINNISLAQLNLDQLVQVLSESRQRPARLAVRRPGNARLMTFTLTPEEMASPSVDRAFLLADGIGYVRATSFEGETGKQMQEAIDKLGGASLKGLVLDLRGNGGGIVTSALEAAALFLKPGQVLVSVRGRARSLEEVKVPASGKPYAFPIAVLVNEKTASAAEIVTGALQDHDRAQVFGTATFGKGLVQSVYPLPEGAGIALTTAFYFTPSGRSIQRPIKEGQLRDGKPLYGNLEAGTTSFKTAAGRAVKGGGGIEPDEAILHPAQTRLQLFLDANGILTAYATEFLSSKPAVTPEFAVTGKHLDDLQVFLSERNIRPGVAEWSADREWIRTRLHQEIFNQALGVEKGDEVELRQDRAVRRAIEWLRTAAGR
ncbi:MAG: S41 family peptidase [Acidobacteria bacterium]|nr:S41 family peptidase [Acidobacteriota bacterium]